MRSGDENIYDSNLWKEKKSKTAYYMFDNRDKVPISFIKQLTITKYLLLVYDTFLTQIILFSTEFYLILIRSIEEKVLFYI